jgi:predicted cobalt transporter CbtA
MELLEKVHALLVLPTEVSDPIVGSGIVSLSMLFNIAFNLVAGVGYGWSFIALSLGFVTFVTSAGDKYKVKDGWKRIQFGLYGVLITTIGYGLKLLLEGLLTGTPLDIPGVTIGSSQ